MDKHVKSHEYYSLFTLDKSEGDFTVDRYPFICTDRKRTRKRHHFPKDIVSFQNRDRSYSQVILLPLARLLSVGAMRYVDRRSEQMARRERTSDVEGKFTSDVKDTFTSEVKDTFTYEVKNTFTSDVKGKFTSDVKDTFTSEVKDMFTSEDEDKFTSDVKDTFTSEVKDTFISEVKTVWRISWRMAGISMRNFVTSLFVTLSVEFCYYCLMYITVDVQGLWCIQF